MTRKWLLLSLKALLSVALIAWVFHAKQIDVGAALSRLGDMAPGLIPPVAAVFLLQVLFCSFRWRGVLHAVGATLDFVPGFRLMYIGAFFHQTLPPRSAATWYAPFSPTGSACPCAVPSTASCSNGW